MTIVYGDGTASLHELRRYMAVIWYCTGILSCKRLIALAIKSPM
jgi:hypothetical protein